MDSQKALESRGAVAPTAGEPAMLEPEAIIEQLRALTRQIPKFGHLPGSTRRLLRGAANANPAFVQAALATVGASQVVQDAVGRTPEELRQESELADRWSAVEVEARALLEGVAAANLARRHRVALAALKTYSISRQLVRGDEHSDLLPHVAEMRRLNRFGRSRRKAEQPAAPAPGPAPVPQFLL